MEVYHRPASMFVAGFIGAPAMNFLPGTIAASGDAVSIPGGQVVATDRALGGEGRPVTVGIRPEHLSLAAGTEGERTVSLSVELVEALGADTVVHGRIGGEGDARSEEHTSELQSLMRISYAVCCLKKKKKQKQRKN